MTYVIVVKCPKCGEVYTTPMNNYAPRLNIATGWWMLICPECQKKIDLEQAQKLAVNVEVSDVKI